MLAVPTACPFCSCGCGFYLLAKEGQLVGVAPSETHPVSDGRLCARGWSAHEAALWGDRLRQPLLQRNGKQESVSWDEALDHVAGRLKELMNAGKPVGVLGSSRATNEENYLAGRLARAGLQTNNVDFSYHPICRPLLAGLEEVCGKHAPSIRLNDIASSQVILLTEGNLFGPEGAGKGCPPYNRRLQKNANGTSSLPPPAGDT
jgi:predicted molibdopterin-dependent oxidoreductase YjgC